MRLYRLDGVFRAFSRPSAKLPDGREYTDRLQHIFDDLPKNFDNYMADCELFTGTWGQTMTLAKKLDMPEEQRRKLKAVLLDFVDVEAVDKYGKDPTPLFERRQVVLDVCKNREAVVPVEARIISTPEALDAYYREALDAGFEGLVLKDPNSPYVTVRSSAWGKLKPKATAEGVVVGFTPGTGKHEGRLGACKLEYEGTRVDCGGGYTDHERDYIWQNQKLFTGLSLEFKYQPDPEIKARFLVFKRFRWDAVDVQPPVGYKGR
jgi:ATP-dependent DNA ligase